VYKIRCDHAILNNVVTGTSVAPPRMLVLIGQQINNPVF
jgi:hypothetical protein